MRNSLLLNIGQSISEGFTLFLQHPKLFVALLIAITIVAIPLIVAWWKIQQRLENLVPAPADTRGFLEISSRTGPLLLSINAIAKVQKDEAGRPVITLLTHDKTGLEEVITVDMNHGELLKKVKRAANTR
jgi:hypothetical protein